MHDGTCTGTIENVVLLNLALSCGCQPTAIACPELAKLFVAGSPLPRLGDMPVAGFCPACGMPADVRAIDNRGNETAVMALASLGDIQAIMLLMDRQSRPGGRHAAGTG